MSPEELRLTIRELIENYWYSCINTKGVYLFPCKVHHLEWVNYWAQNEYEALLCVNPHVGAIKLINYHDRRGVLVDTDTIELTRNNADEYTGVQLHDFTLTAEDERVVEKENAIRLYKNNTYSSINHWIELDKDIVQVNWTRPERYLISLAPKKPDSDGYYAGELYKGISRLYEAHRANNFTAVIEDAELNSIVACKCVLANNCINIYTDTKTIDKVPILDNIHEPVDVKSNSTDNVLSFNKCSKHYIIFNSKL